MHERVPSLEYARPRSAVEPAGLRRTAAARASPPCRVGAEVIFSRRVAGLLLAAYVVVGALIVFWPTGDIASESVRAIWDVLREAGAPVLLSPHVVEFGTNVLLFVPLGFLGHTLVPRWRWLGWLLAGLAASTVIELTQYVFLSGRDASVLDIVANTSGAVAGYLAAVLLPRSRRR